MASAPEDQSSAGTGRPADRTATSMIHEALQAAGAATRRPTGSATRKTTPPARPSTVAGPTTGAARRLATTATRLTWPEIAATSGVHATCAASGTATASATQRGSHRASRSRQPGASHRMPAVAVADSANPGESASHGSSSTSSSTAAPRARVPRRRPWWPIPTSPTVPMAAARTTLGSVRASSTNPRTPTAPTTTSPRARTPAHRASTSRQPTTRVRLVPETASRWVSPEVRNASVRAGGIPASSPSTRAGTRWRGPTSWWSTAPRMPARSVEAPRRSGPGPSSSCGGPRLLNTPARSSVRAWASRPDRATRAPSGSPAALRSPMTRTGARTRCR